MPEHVILFRQDGTNREELCVAKSFFEVHEYRAPIQGKVVIGRYSVLPYYRELELDLNWHGSRLINSYEQHRWVASAAYVGELCEHTFETWDEQTYLRRGYDGPVVVKGRTNSRKHDWNRLMFARNRQEAIRVACELRQDPFIGPQGLLFRRYEPLRTFEVGLNGLRFTNEWRFFYLGARRLAHGYYWTEAEDVESPRVDAAGLAFADEVAAAVSQRMNFFVVDIAERESGGWVLVEINDGQQSGLSMIEPGELYGGLADALSGA